jgi:hypothetical protein
MKKTIVMAALGLAASAASSFGQGSVLFSSYVSNNSAGTYTYLFNTTTQIPAGFHADLYDAAGNVSDPVNNANQQSVTAAPAGLTDLGIVGVNYALTASGGIFFDDPSPVTTASAAAGITFEVVAFNGSTYANSTIRGRSGSFFMTGLNASPAPLNALGDNGTGFPAFYVAPVPEPTTLALAGLGGLASLVALRRKQA